MVKSDYLHIRIRIKFVTRAVFVIIWEAVSIKEKRSDPTKNTLLLGYVGSICTLKGKPIR